MEWFKAFADEWANRSEIAGMVITLVGFFVTIIGVWRSKHAADEARRAAEAARDSLAHYNVIAELASAAAFMEEVKRLQRSGAWDILPDRYAELRRRLVTIKSYPSLLEDQQRVILQSAIEKFSELENLVVIALDKRTTPVNPPKFNAIVSTHLDQVHSVLVNVQRSVRPA